MSELTRVPVLEEAPAMNLTIELGDEGRRRFLAALAQWREHINPGLTPDALVCAIFLYGLDKVELELAVAKLPQDSRGRILTP